MEYYYILEKIDTIWKIDEITNESIPEKELLRRKIWREKKNIDKCKVNDNNEMIDNDEYINREIVKIMFDINKRTYKNFKDLENIKNIDNYLIDIRDFFKPADKLCSLLIFSNEIYKEFKLFNYCKKLIITLNSKNKLDSEITSELTYIIKDIINCLLYIKDNYINLSNNAFNVYTSFIDSLKIYGYEDNVFYSNINLQNFKNKINDCIIYIKKNTNINLLIEY